MLYCCNGMFEDILHHFDIEQIIKLTSSQIITGSNLT